MVSEDMIKMALFFSLCFSSGSVFAQDQPAAVRELIAKRDQAIERINETFIKELLKLQSAYTKKGDLENAKKVAALISDTSISENPETPRSKVFKLEGKWTYKIEGGKFVVREFKGKYLIDEGGTRRRWRRLGDTLTIHWGGDLFEKVTITEEDPDILKGTNGTGRAIVYERIKD